LSKSFEMKELWYRKCHSYLTLFVSKHEIDATCE